MHLHLEGTLSPKMLLALSVRNGLDFPYGSVEEIEAALASRPPGLQGFLDHHYLAVSTMQTRRDFIDVTYELLRACRDNNIVYSEIFFDPQYHTSRGITFDDMFAGIDEGRFRGEDDFEVKANHGIRLGGAMGVHRWTVRRTRDAPGQDRTLDSHSHKTVLTRRRILRFEFHCPLGEPVAAFRNPAGR